jgi:hypothetical protein
VRGALDLMLQLNQSLALASNEHFRNSVAPGLALGVLEALLSRNHAPLRDDMCQLLYQLTVAVDHPRFFGELLPTVLMRLPFLSDDQRRAVMEGFGRDTDELSFCQNVKAFLSDVRAVQDVSRVSA